MREIKSCVGRCLAFAAVALATSTGLFAETETIGGVKWSYYPVWDDDEAAQVAVVSGATPLKGVLNIPSSLGGLEVREIGAYAFCDGDKVTEVVIPASVIRIGKSAFDSCIGLTSVSIPGNVKEIGEAAFWDCHALESVNLAEGVEVLGEAAFCDCWSLGDVLIPSTVMEIGAWCFSFAGNMTSVSVAEGNPYFKSIDGVVYSKDGSRLVLYPPARAGDWTVPEHVTEIVEFAFSGSSLSAITIGSGVEKIGKSAFICSFGLSRIAVDAANPHFKDADGILFSKDGMLMLAYPAAKKDVSVYTVPATVTRLDEGVFSGTSLAGVILPSTLAILPTESFLDSKSLKSVIVGYGVKTVSEEAFHDLSLTGLTLPTTVEEIGECVFEDCGTSKTTIYVPKTAVADKDAYVDCPAKIVKYASAPLVKFDLNCDGAPNYPYDRNVISGQPVGILMTPVRDHATFVGWYTLPNGGTKITASTVVTGDVTYYAHWTDGTSPVTPGYDVIDEEDIVAPYAASKAVTLQGAVYDGGDVVGVVELKLGKVNANKGTSKVSGTVTGLDGKKHTIKAVGVSGIDGVSPVSVSLDVRDFGTMEIAIGGDKFAGSLGDYHVQSCEIGGAWNGGTANVTVEIGDEDLDLFPGMLLTSLLPDEETATVKNGKWTFAKAASVKWAKPKKGAALPEIYDEALDKGLIIDVSKDKTNLSGLKLAYTPKKGTFKGSFKVYALEGASPKQKLKKYTVNVSGIVINSCGSGMATCKKPALAWPVTVR